jgi:anti-anti-sigma factor
MESAPLDVGSPAPATGTGLSVEVDDHRTPGRRLLRVRGELDLATAGLLAGAIERAAADGPDVDVDVSGVTFCDVVGATAIEQAVEQLRARGRRLTLLGGEGPLHLLLGVEAHFGGLRAGADGDPPA